MPRSEFDPPRSNRGGTFGHPHRLGMSRLGATAAVATVCLVVVVALAGLAWLRSGSAAGGGRGGETSPAAVEVATIEVGCLEGRRAYSATLEARARVTIAPKVAGTIVSLPVDLGDLVARGDVIARLDSAEFGQAAAQAEAEMEVVRAQLAEARSAAEIAARELSRSESLHERGIASDAQLDTVRAQDLSARSAVAVARAQLERARAAREAAEIRLGYATIRADWDVATTSDDATRVIARRMAEVGDTVGANTPILSVVELDPIRAVFFATQRDYGRLGIGQRVSVSAEAFPERSWQGEIARIAPVFDEASRQARIEVVVPNADLALKPGMFVRAEVVLDVAESSAIIPEAALTRRDGRDLVFVLKEDGKSVRAQPVTIVVDAGDRVAVEASTGNLLPGSRVVTLGHQLIGDGSSVVVPDAPVARAESASIEAQPSADPTPSEPAAAGGGA